MNLGNTPARNDAKLMTDLRRAYALLVKLEYAMKVYDSPGDSRWPVNNPCRTDVTLAYWHIGKALAEMGAKLNETSNVKRDACSIQESEPAKQNS